MGDKRMGGKNLVRMLGNKRYFKVFFSKGNNRISMTVTNSSLGHFIEWHEKHGYITEKVEEKS